MSEKPENFRQKAETETDSQKKIDYWLQELEKRIEGYKRGPSKAEFLSQLQNPEIGETQPMPPINLETESDSTIQEILKERRNKSNSQLPRRDRVIKKMYEVLLENQKDTSTIKLDETRKIIERQGLYTQAYANDLPELLTSSKFSDEVKVNFAKIIEQEWAAHNSPTRSPRQNSDS